MKLILIRNQALKDKTTGILYNDKGESIGYTIEPSIAQYSHAGQIAAMAEGRYELEVRNNPSAGTPTIKIKGRFIPSNSSIRCCRPIGANNCSVVLLSSPDGDGNPKTLDCMAWTELLTMIEDRQNREEKVVLEIIERPSPSAS